MNFYACKFYITYACNSRCAYCNIWCDDKYKSYSILPLDQAKKKVDELYDLGVRYIDFTGGEPALYPWISELLQHTRQKGIVVEFTTNGLAFEKSIEKIVPYVDNMNVSLDTLSSEVYKKHRGIDGIDKVLKTITAIQSRGKNVKVIAVMTQENEKDMDSLLAYAQQHRVSVYFSPLFDYFDMELEKKMSLYTLERILHLFYSPFAIVYLHFLKFLESVSPDSFSECSSNKKILTLHPDGSIAVPCYHHYEESLPTEKGIQQTLLSSKFQFYQENTGRMENCKGCTIFPYLGVSFSYHFNRIFFYQAFSEEYQKIKMLFLNEYYPGLPLSIPELIQEYRSLEKILQSSIPDTQDDVLFYYGTKIEDRVYIPFFQEPLLVSEYLMDNLNEYCWNIEYSPHTGIKYFYRSLLPYLKRSVEQGKISKEVYLEILQGFSRFHIQWWCYFLHRYYNRKENKAGESWKPCLLNYINKIMAAISHADRDDTVLSHLMLLYATIGEKKKFPIFTISKDLERAVFRFSSIQNLLACYASHFSQRYHKWIHASKANLVQIRNPAEPHDFNMASMDRQKLFSILDYLQDCSSDELHNRVRSLAKSIDKEKIHLIRDFIEEYETEYRPEFLLKTIRKER